MNLPGLRLHKLEGKVADFWALEVNGKGPAIIQFGGPGTELKIIWLYERGRMANETNKA